MTPWKKLFSESSEITDLDLGDLLKVLKRLIEQWDGENPSYIDELYGKLESSLDSELVTAIDGVLMSDQFDRDSAASSIKRMLGIAEDRHGTEPNVAIDSASTILSRYIGKR
jgi:hypothetical protein